MQPKKIFIFAILFFSFSIVNAQSSLSFPFRATDLTSENLAWLNPLGERIKDSEIVGLGEVSHGDHESKLLKCRLVKYLIKEKGFRELLVEFGDPYLRRLNTFLGDDSIKEMNALDSLFQQAFTTNEYHATLYNADFKELLRWIKLYNIDNPTKKVSIRGMDIVLDWNIFWKGWMDLASKNKVRAQYGIKDLSTDEISAIIKNWYKTEKQHLKDSLSADAFEDLQMDVRNFLSYITYIKNGDSKNSSMIEMRDSLMNENVGLLLKNKSMIWAHNMHISNAGFAPFKQFKAKMLGNFLKEKYAGKYFIIMADYASIANVNISVKNEFKIRSFKSNHETLAYEMSRLNKNQEGLVFSSDFKEQKAIKFNSIGLQGDYFVIPTNFKSFDALFFFKELTPLMFIQDARK